MDTSILSNPFLWRGVERLMVAAGAVIFGFLGYRLYRLGIARKSGDVKVQSRFLSFVLSGTGPGLVFMAFGAVVLVAGLFSGGAALEQGAGGQPAPMGKESRQEKRYLYTVSVDECMRLANSPDAALPGALKTARMPWAPRLAERVSDVTVLKTVVEAICAE